MVPVLLFLLFIGTGARAQVDIPLQDVIKANFGVEGDLYANTNQINGGNDYLNTDDWFFDAQWLGDGEGVIDVMSAQAQALISQLELDENANISGELGQSKPIYTFDEFGYLWIDAVYGRDQRTNGNLSDQTFFTSTADKNFDDPETWNIGEGSGGPQKNDIIEFVGH